jgi:hypothetical protein
MAVIKKVAGIWKTAPNTNSIDLERSSTQYAYIDDGDQTGLDLVDDYTIECWVKLESFVKTAFVNKIDVSVGGPGYMFYLEDTEDRLYVQTYISLNSRFDIYATFTNTYVGSWVHLAATLDVSAGTGVIYINGSAVSTTASGAGRGVGASTCRFIIGARGTDTQDNYMDGLMDEVRVWSDIRTAQEISDNYNKQLVGDEAGLVGYWKFNNSALDETANNNDLTLVNTPVYSTTVPFAGGSVIKKVAGVSKP